MNQAQVRLTIGPNRVPCDDGTGVRDCLQVRRSSGDAWELFYDTIEGFDPAPGVTYDVTVSVSEAGGGDSEPYGAIDGSAVRYRLISIDDQY